MDVIINEISSTVSAVDSDTLLSPETTKKIVRIVLEAVEAREAHRARRQIEQAVTHGVRRH